MIIYYVYCVYVCRISRKLILKLILHNNNNNMHLLYIFYIIHCDVLPLSCIVTRLTLYDHTLYCYDDSDDADYGIYTL